LERPRPRSVAELQAKAAREFTSLAAPLIAPETVERTFLPWLARTIEHLAKAAMDEEHYAIFDGLPRPTTLSGEFCRGYNAALMRVLDVMLERRKEERRAEEEAAIDGLARLLQADEVVPIEAIANALGQGRG
jgi:hypothetical protein